MVLVEVDMRHPVKAAVRPGKLYVRLDCAIASDRLSISRRSSSKASWHASFRAVRRRCSKYPTCSASVAASLCGFSLVAMAHATMEAKWALNCKRNGGNGADRQTKKGGWGAWQEEGHRRKDNRASPGRRGEQLHTH